MHYLSNNAIAEYKGIYFKFVYGKNETVKDPNQKGPYLKGIKVLSTLIEENLVVKRLKFSLTY